MSTMPVESEVVVEPHELETPLEVLDSVWARNFSEAMAYAHGYKVDVALSDEIQTSMTSLSLIDKNIRIQISRQLIEKAESEDQLDFLGFNILHELGHAKRYALRPSNSPSEPKYSYFQNIVEDIAINFDAARQTRFFANLTKKAYDQYLFPAESRGKIATEPRHKQFMEASLLLAMTTGAYRHPQSTEELNKVLEDIGCIGLDQAVIDRLAQVVNFSDGKKSFNLLQQLREYGEDLPYYDRVVTHIRVMYDELYEEDKNDQQQQSGEPQQGDGQSSEATEFDYSNTGGCNHGEQLEDDPKSDQKKDGQNPQKNNDKGSIDNDKGKPDIAEVGKQIGEQIADVIEKDKATGSIDQQQQRLNEEQLARFREELGLNESDFQGYLDTVSKYFGEIAAVTESILQLKRERLDNFLAPSHEISARGHRVHFGKLLGYLASGSQEAMPDIWKTPAFKERVEYDFDGADFYFLCDTSISMAGDKANTAAESSVVLSQGIQDAGLESYDDIPPIRIQVQGFGSGDETLCELTDLPTNTELGRMYSSLKNPHSSSTQVKGALEKIKAAEGRLSLVFVLSDGQFHDESTAAVEGQRIEDEGAVIVQCVFGRATVGKLSKNARRMDVRGADDLPNYMFGIMPELIQALRTTHHA